MGARHAETRTTIGAPTTRPIGRVEPVSPSSVVLHFTDVETPLRLAKPSGVQGCQIFSYVGDSAPADPDGYSFLALHTRTPYRDEHPESDAGKKVFYILRWQNAKGETGPFSEMVTATIPK